MHGPLVNMDALGLLASGGKVSLDRASHTTTQPLDARAFACPGIGCSDRLSANPRWTWLVLANSLTPVGGEGPSTTGQALVALATTVSKRTLTGPATRSLGLQRAA